MFSTTVCFISNLFQSFLFSATFISEDIIAQLNSIATVYGVDLTNTGASANYLYRIVDRHNRRVLAVNNPTFITPSSEAFQRLNSFVSHSKLSGF